MPSAASAAPSSATRANYLLQRFFRQVVGTNNIDHRDGSAVAALPTGLPTWPT